MTKFNVGDAVVLTNPGTHYTSTYNDSLINREAFAKVLLQYPNNETRSSNIVNDTFLGASNLQSPNWNGHGIVVAIDPLVRLGTQAYAVVFTSNSGQQACCVFGEHGLKIYTPSNTTINKNTKSITKQDILLLMEASYAAGQSENSMCYQVDLRVLEIFDKFTHQLFGTPKTFDNTNAYKKINSPF
jgi:hypothetical protein